MSIHQDVNDHNHALELWEHIFADLRGMLCISVLDRDAAKGGMQEYFFPYPKGAERAQEWAQEQAERGKDVYFCAHLLEHSDEKIRRRKEYAAAVRALWADGDGATVPDHLPQPTYAVESSPGKDHFYWLLDSEILPAAAEQLNKGIADTIGADPSGYDLTQLLRVPGTLNYKYDEPHTVRTTRAAGEAYAPADLERAFPAPVEESENGYHESADEPPVALDDPALVVWRGEQPKGRPDTGEIDRSGTLMHIGRVLYDAGLTRVGLVPALRERDESLGYNKYTGRRDPDGQYHKIVDELEASGRNPRIKVGGSAAPEPAPEPEMDAAAYRGLFGEIVELADPHIEGDKVAVLLSALTAVGNALGRGPYKQVGATKHRPNLFTALVGDTSKARKGTTWDPIRDIMQAADKVWVVGRVSSGLSSGEGLIAEVRDEVRAPGSDGDMKVIVPGEPDKRLLVMEGELAQVLKVIKREGNTLSPILRNAWDGQTLKTMVKHNPLKATDPHVSVLGHITRTELTQHLAETEMANGLANRFLWAKVKRSKLLPFGGEWHTVNVMLVASDITDMLTLGQQESRMEWAADGRKLWEEVYPVLTADRPGMFGAITARAEAQTLRLSMLYALAEHSLEIRKTHIESALAVWDYCEGSARAIFGDTVGNPDADKVLEVLKESGELTRTDVLDLFDRNRKPQQLDHIRRVLEESGKITANKELREGSKKRAEVWRLA